MLKIKPFRSEYKTIETLTSQTTRRIQIYKVNIDDIRNTFTFETELNRLEREVLLTLPNPNYSSVINKYEHLKGVTMNENSKKFNLPIHAILGACDYAKIKTNKSPPVGDLGQPFAENTKVGWVLMSPGREYDVTNALFAQTFTDYDRLCSLDVLGVEDRANEMNDLTLERFERQLDYNEEGYYETGLIWKEQDMELGNNKRASVGRLNSLLKYLKQNKTFEDVQQYNKRSVRKQSY